MEGLAAVPSRQERANWTIRPCLGGRGENSTGRGPQARCSKTRLGPADRVLRMEAARSPWGFHGPLCQSSCQQASVGPRHPAIISSKAEGRGRGLGSSPFRRAPPGRRRLHPALSLQWGGVTLSHCLFHPWRVKASGGGPHCWGQNLQGT